MEAADEPVSQTGAGADPSRPVVPVLLLLLLLLLLRPVALRLSLTSPSSVARLPSQRSDKSTTRRHFLPRKGSLGERDKRESKKKERQGDAAARRPSETIHEALECESEESHGNRGGRGPAGGPGVRRAVTGGGRRACAGAAPSSRRGSCSVRQPPRDLPAYLRPLSGSAAALKGEAAAGGDVTPPPPPPPPPPLSPPLSLSLLRHHHPSSAPSALRSSGAVMGCHLLPDCRGRLGRTSGARARRARDQSASALSRPRARLPARGALVGF